MTEQDLYSKLVNDDDVPPGLAWWAVFGEDIHTHLNFMCIPESEWKQMDQDQRESDQTHFGYKP